MIVLITTLLQSIEQNKEKVKSERTLSVQAPPMNRLQGILLFVFLAKQTTQKAILTVKETNRTVQEKNRFVKRSNHVGAKRTI